MFTFCAFVFAFVVFCETKGHSEDFGHMNEFGRDQPYNFQQSTPLLTVLLYSNGIRKKNTFISSESTLLEHRSITHHTEYYIRCAQEISATWVVHNVCSTLFGFCWKGIQKKNTFISSESTLADPFYSVLPKQSASINAQKSTFCFIFIYYSYIISMKMLMSTSSVAAKRQEKAAIRIFDVIVVGGGLSGLMVGQGLQKMSTVSPITSSPAGVEWKLLEARPVLGGRLANNNKSSAHEDGQAADNGIIDNAADKIDMGGAWIWPFHQPYVKSLVRMLNLQTFTQPDEPSSTRIAGGAVEIIRSLASTIIIDTHANDEPRIETRTPISSCTLETFEETNLVRLDTPTNQKFFARRVVFALPPKLLHKNVAFNPPLSTKKQAALESSHTWMAGVTKVALVYPKRFWDLENSYMGLPQEHGPAFQVYDSGTKDESVSALTFFTLVKPDNRPALEDDSTLAKQVATQMAKVWTYLRQPEVAKKSHSYTNYYVQRWPMERYISEDDRPNTIHPHPHPVPALSEPEWNGLLEFAGSEMDRKSPGVMEGAVSAATRVLQSLDPFLQALSPDRARSMTNTNNKDGTTLCTAHQSEISEVAAAK